MKEYIGRDLFDEDGNVVGREYSGELIRCKDCIFYNGHENYCDVDMYARENGYCYVAERKEK